MKQANGQKPVSRVRASVVLSIASVVFTGLTVLGIWLMWRYMYDPTKVREIIGVHYVLGALCMILISAVQVVVALIPGELVEISAGYVFGAWGGALLCLAGTTLAVCWCCCWRGGSAVGSCTPSTPRRRSTLCRFCAIRKNGTF